MEAAEFVTILQQNNELLKKDIYNVIDNKIATLTAKMEAGDDVINGKLNQVISHQEKQNGWINTNATTLLAHTKLIELLQGNQAGCVIKKSGNFLIKRWYVTIGVLFAFFIAAEFVYHDSKVFSFIIDVLKVVK